MRSIFWFPTLLLAAAGLANAASTVRLPASFCPASDAIFWDGFESISIPTQPSNGSGGTYPGDITRTINVVNLGTRTYFLRLPPNYTPAHAWPILLALRGQSLPTASAAQQVRSDWSSWADSRGFIVLAPVGNSTQGGWAANGDIEEIGAALDDAFASYNVEQSRVYLWGFSAGAHYGHALALDNTNYFAAYGVSSGSLTQYACSASGVFQPVCSSWLPTIQPKIPVDIHIGTSDEYGLFPEAQADVARFMNAGWQQERTLFFRSFAGGHIYTVTQLGEIWNNLCPFALGP